LSGGQGFVRVRSCWQTTAIVTRNVNLRATPSTAQTPIRLLVPEETLTLITTTTVNGYYHVRTAQNEEGWVYRTFVKIGGTPPAPAAPAAAAVCGPGTEIVVHPSCPAVGTHGQNVAYAANPDAGLRNIAKRHVPDPVCSPKPLTLDDLHSLQNYIDNTFARENDQDRVPADPQLEEHCDLRWNPQRRRLGAPECVSHDRTR